MRRTNPASPVRRPAGRLATAAVVAAVTTTTLALPATPAAADEVAAARQRVARTQAAVVAATERLAQGSRAWEADQRELRALEAQQRDTRARVAATQQVADRATARLDGLARRMYMHPVVLGDVQQLLGAPPEVSLEALRTHDAVERVAGSEGTVIHEAKQARLALRREQAALAQQTEQAKAVAARSAARVAELRALASDLAQRLAAAERALGSARVRQARLRAARARALAALGGARCTATGSAGRPNGMLDPSSLCPLWGAPGHRLRRDAASAFNRLSLLHRRATGRPLCVTDSYRSYAAQVDVYQRKPELAAVPGRSRHGWGLALDLCGGVQVFGSVTHRWMRAFGPRFGWVHPAWAGPSGSKPEAWHWEFRG